MCKYVVLDLEMCRVPGAKQKEYRYANETIEIGAVLLDESLEVQETFSTFVSPEYGKIDKYIYKLTGISNEQIDGAPKFKEALESFMDWVPEDAVWVAWSDNDKRQFKKETQCKAIEIPELDKHLEELIDCQKLFAERKDTRRNYKLSDALVSACIDYADGAHDALVDARNTALLFAKMEKNPDMEFVSYCLKGEELEKFSYVPLYELFPQFNFAS